MSDIDPSCRIDLWRSVKVIQVLSTPAADVAIGEDILLFLVTLSRAKSFMIFPREELSVGYFNVDGVLYYISLCSLAYTRFMVESMLLVNTETPIKQKR